MSTNPEWLKQRQQAGTGRAGRVFHMLPVTQVDSSSQCDIANEGTSSYSCAILRTGVSRLEVSTKLHEEEARHGVKGFRLAAELLPAWIQPKLRPYYVVILPLPRSQLSGLRSWDFRRPTNQGR